MMKLQSGTEIPIREYKSGIVYTLHSYDGLEIQCMFKELVPAGAVMVLANIPQPEAQKILGTGREFILSPLSDRLLKKVTIEVK